MINVCNVQFLREIFQSLFAILEAKGEKQLTDSNIKSSTAMAMYAHMHTHT